MNDHTEIIEVPSGQEAPHKSPGILDPNASMVLLTWVTFFLLLAVLYKFAWKPILAGLDAREAAIRKSVEEAERIRQEMLKIEEARKEILAEADRKSKDIIDQSRKAAVEAAKVINEKAKKDTQILFENAQRDIKDSVEKAQADLRQESARVAVELAGRILEENLDSEKNRKLIDQYIKNI